MLGNINSPGMAAAAIAAMLLTACGGGGGGGPSGAGVPSAFGRGAGGVTVAVSRANGASTAGFAFTRGGAAWTADPSGGHAHMPSGVNGWFGAAKTDAAGSAAQERIAAYADIEEASAPPNSVADADYLVFGYWNELADYTRVTPFYWGPMPYAGDVTARTAPSVAYHGLAAGTFKSAGHRHRGYFTASATLTADFRAGILSGRVRGFQLRIVTNDAPPTTTGASVSLNPINLTGNHFSGATGNGGAWSGSFFGPAGADPTGVAGVFDDRIATTINGEYVWTAVTGAFGATR